MWAFIFSFLMPVVPILIRRSYNRDKEMRGRELVARYAVYTLCMTAISLLAMTPVCEEGISFLAKVDGSVSFALKYLAVEVAAAAVTAAVEWYVTAGSLRFRLDKEQWRSAGFVRLLRKLVVSYGIYLLAAVVVLMNASLMFDHVLWGDEAFSANTVRNEIPGILQIMHYWDNHPPLYYFWLRLWVNLLGEAGWVLHLASLLPFTAGILVAVTLFKKKFGTLPAAVFVVTSGLAAPCVEYNLEVRMYALCFFGVAMAFYCCYRIIGGGRLAWFGMVLWGLIAAYSHYYGLVICGVLIFITAVASAMKYRGKTWIKGVAALLMYIIGYLPWFAELFSHTENVKGNWWNDTILSLGDSLTMVGGGNSFKGILLGMAVILTLILILAESGFFHAERQEGKMLVRIGTPSIKGWSEETYFCAIGCLTIIGTLVLAYLLCMLVNPVLAQRYLYMLIAITLLVVVAGWKGVLRLLRTWAERDSRAARAELLGKLVLLLVLAVLAVKGLGDYKAYSDRTRQEKAATEELLGLIGEVDEDVRMVSYRVDHLGWTVLKHYFPDNEVVNGSCTEVDADRFWFFTYDYLSQETLTEMGNKGYKLYGYGEKQLCKYPLVLYYFER